MDLPSTLELVGRLALAVALGVTGSLGLPLAQRLTLLADRDDVASLEVL